MKKLFTRMVLLTLSIILIVGSFSLNASAQSEEANNFTEEDVKDLAKKLEFVFEEATTKDAEGNIISIDIEKVEAKYGTSPELENLKEVTEAQQANSNANTNDDDKITTGESIDIGLPMVPSNDYKDFNNPISKKQQQ
ncbi:hypothetical protein ABFG93_13600 [Pseudalkalibacillus hwajinpoensis]|uniref:hypothetical protein n=1 Tax=Guptibacillus hwajinpoensis TaxID=208199 RepID=UPI00325B411E